MKRTLNALTVFSLAVFLLLVLGVKAGRASLCVGPVYRSFDFIIGNWLVKDTSGAVVGTVTTTADYGGCILVEKWRWVRDASEGLGVAGYRPKTGAWHRDFTDAGGVVLAHDGKREGKRMVMTGKEYQNDDAIILHRLTWSPRQGGTLEQVWQTSSDEGKTWQLRRHLVLIRIAE